MLNDDAKVTLLLTSRFGKQDRSDGKPLSPTEWGRFAAWLYSNGASPRDLLAEKSEELLAGWCDKKVTRERLERLLDRGMAMSLSLDRWQSAGLWVMTRSDGDYPRALKNRLREASPPVLFGCGERMLMGSGGLAIVGSREADADALDEAGSLAQLAARDGISIISGGARGVDEAAMTAALEAGGVSIGVLANGLLRSSASSRYRQPLREGRLVLTSPFQPEASFQAGNAMARNKYIYCLSDAAVVLASAHESGGTWSGARENLKKGWVPLFVRRDAAPGHEALVSQGGHWLPRDLETIRPLADGSSQMPTQSAIGGCHDARGADLGEPDSRTAIAGSVVDRFPRALESDRAENALAGTYPERTSGDELQSVPDSFYALFIQHLRHHLENNGRASAKTVAEKTSLPKALVDKWVRQAIDDGIIEKKGKPAELVLVQKDDSQQSLW